ncbi:hypothetical protein CYG48_04815 [Neorhizobium sp. SOG26]|uniref:recombination protein NinB n=1 Tax=Neorhizobium sp. SOG26 TaxID=2060726 RepID=UPI000E581798|nr:recombination protein NinB [Neorhizobium sp. SOG26]AXV15078.1 hypothetical protein CYG48_04815 [Neorhizobium sp. SOG26]
MTTRATVIINHPSDREQVARWAQKVEAGTIVEFRKKTRSNEQNAKLHAMLGEVADQVVWYGVKLKVEDWKNMFTASLRKAQVVPGIDPGTVVPLGIHTSTMTVDEMSNMIEAIYAFGADPEHPVIFKEPKDPDQPNSDEPSPSSEPAGDTASAPAAAGEDSDPPPPGSSPAASLTEAEWLKTAARMLWSATNVGGDTDANLAILNNQRLAVGDLCPPETASAIKEKAGSIYRVCKQAVLSEAPPHRAVPVIAAYAGMDEKELQA